MGIISGIIKRLLVRKAKEKAIITANTIINDKSFFDRIKEKLNIKKNDNK